MRTRVLCALLLLAACGEPAGSGAGNTPGAGGSGAGTGPGAAGASGEAASGGGSSNAGSSTGTSGAGTTAGSAGASSTAGSGSIPIIEGPPPPAITISEYEIPTPSQPGWIAAGPDGSIWYTHQSTAPSAISKVAVAGTPFNKYNVNVTNIGPRGIAPGADGNVWYAKQGGIGRIQPSGQFDESGVPQGGDSAGICLGPDGNVWFTQQIHSKITRITPSQQFQSFDIPTPNSGPLAITTGDDGNLWFTESAVSANKIGRITPAGEISEFAIPTPASNPTGIVQGPDDALWFTMHDARKIGRITPAGVITEFYIPSGNSPGRIVAGDDGNLWFTQSGAANSIGRITPLGQVSEYRIPTENSDPFDIVKGPDGNLWFTEISANQVGRVSNLSGGGTLQANAPGEMTIDELGGDTPCSKDSDCKESGKACGGDVCSAEKKLCVLAVSADPGSCGADADCWCRGEGATCSAGHCSFTVHGGGP